MKRCPRTSLTEQAMQALTNAVAKVVEDQRRRAKPLAVWRDGKAVWIPPKQATVLRESPPSYRASSKAK